MCHRKNLRDRNEKDLKIAIKLIFSIMKVEIQGWYKPFSSSSSKKFCLVIWSSFKKLIICLMQCCHCNPSKSAFRSCLLKSLFLLLFFRLIGLITLYTIEYQVLNTIFIKSEITLWPLWLYRIFSTLTSCPV